MKIKNVVRGFTTFLAVGAVGVVIAACGKKGPDGIAECDDFVKSVDTCKNAAAKDGYKAEVDGFKEQFKSVAQDKVKEHCTTRGSYWKEQCDAGPDGVPECEEYFKVMSTCSNETQKTNEKNNRENWKTQTKKIVSGNCKSALEMAKKFCK